MTTCMFPGQGSQVKGMGAELFAQFPTEMKLAQEVLGYSMQDLCLNDSQEQLGNTAYTQPALFVVEALTYQSEYAIGLRPNYCIGHSLGEYTALFAAGAFDFVTGLKLVQKRGALMNQASSGAMLAVINVSVDRIRELLQFNELNGVDFANYNSPKQIILSGLTDDIRRASDILSKEASMCVPLKVSGAFHSRYMETAAKEFEQFINQFTFSNLQIPVIANVTAQPYTDSIIKENLVKQIFSPVRWTDTISYLKSRGESEFIEVGPGNVLTRLMKQN